MIIGVSTMLKLFLGMHESKVHKADIDKMSEMINKQILIFFMIINFLADCKIKLNTSFKY